MTADGFLVHAWLSARMIARGLPAPVPDHGGYRVETNSDVEVRRWVFPQICAGLVSLAEEIREPRNFVKVFADREALQAILPRGWQLQPRSYFMRGSGLRIAAPPVDGYAMEVEQNGAATQVRFVADGGALAARGYAVETADVFIYDRIATMPEHRRKGLGTALMAALGRAKQRQATPELLVATEEGRALYTRLGWKVIAPYASASFG